MANVHTLSTHIHLPRVLADREGLRDESGDEDSDEDDFTEDMLYEDNNFISV
jgi:hypothetical protein